jgi:hypothetical protein
MNIQVKVIDHTKQEYPTVGNWSFNDAGDLSVEVSSMGDWRYESLVAVHEIIEALLCQERGISGKEITIFDKRFEDNRKKGNSDEPGDDQQAPYKDEHFFATNIERLLAAELGVDWKEYDKTVVNL